MDILQKLVSGIIFSLSAHCAIASTNIEILQMPQCLAQHVDNNYLVLAENSAFKIIQIPHAELRNLSRLADQVHCGRFVNLSHKFQTLSARRQEQTARTLLQKKKATTLAAENYKISHSKEVSHAYKLIEPSNITQSLVQLSAFTNRSSTQPSGKQTASWLKSQFEAMALEHGRKDTTTFFVATGGRYVQPSLVTVLGKDINKPALVIGAHMDTLGDSPDERMPGADDDGSGTASVLEMTRVLLASDVKLKRPIYIIWYAAEEEGLVGSQQVVQYFSKNAIPVFAAIQFDMTGYRSKEQDKTMWVFRDFTDKKLSDFTAQLIRTYLKVPVKFSKCGYGCSDHASWNDKGIPAAFPCETSFEKHNPYIHSASDSMNNLNLEHMTNFTKLAVAFAIELSI